MNLAYRYLEEESFDSYEDFCRGLRIKVPESFNFAFDIIDEYARLEPERKRWYGAMTMKRRKPLLSLILRSGPQKQPIILNPLG